MIDRSPLAAAAGPQLQRNLFLFSVLGDPLRMQTPLLPLPGGRGDVAFLLDTPKIAWCVGGPTTMGPKKTWLSFPPGPPRFLPKKWIDEQKIPRLQVNEVAALQTFVACTASRVQYSFVHAKRKGEVSSRGHFPCLAPLLALVRAVTLPRHPHSHTHTHTMARHRTPHPRRAKKKCGVESSFPCSLLVRCLHIFRSISLTS